MSNRIAVTGAAGFLGSNICSQLSKSGHQVLGMDRSLKNLPPGCEGSICDIGDHDALRRVLHDFEPDTVLHLVAILTLEAKSDIVGATRANALRTYLRKLLLPVLRELSTRVRWLLWEMPIPALETSPSRNRPVFMGRRRLSVSTLHNRSRKLTQGHCLSAYVTAMSRSRLARNAGDGPSRAPRGC